MQTELLGAPRAWLWIVLLGSALASPALVRGFLRRGKGSRHDGGFLIQRAPQLATAANLFFVCAAFEAIELELGTGEPAFAKATFVALRDYLPFLTLALVLPPLVAGAISWLGVVVSAAGVLFLVSGWLTLGTSFSPDAEIVRGQELRQDGPYRFVLHPVYAGLTTFLLGSAITSLSPFCALITLALVAPLFLRRGKHEESLLIEQFGEAYIAYGERLGWRRLLPTFVPFRA